MANTPKRTHPEFLVFESQAPKQRPASVDNGAIGRRHEQVESSLSCLYERYENVMRLGTLETFPVKQAKLFDKLIKEIIQTDFPKTYDIRCFSVFNNIFRVSSTKPRPADNSTFGRYLASLVMSHRESLTKNLQGFFRWVVSLQNHGEAASQREAERILIEYFEFVCNLHTNDVDISGLIDFTLVSLYLAGVKKHVFRKPHFLEVMIDICITFFPNPPAINVVPPTLPNIIAEKLVQDAVNGTMDIKLIWAVSSSPSLLPLVNILVDQLDVSFLTIYLQAIEQDSEITNNTVERYLNLRRIVDSSLSQCNTYHASATDLRLLVEHSQPTDSFGREFAEECCSAFLKIVKTAPDDDIVDALSTLVTGETDVTFVESVADVLSARSQLLLTTLNVFLASRKHFALDTNTLVAYLMTPAPPKFQEAATVFVSLASRIAEEPLLTSLDALENELLVLFFLHALVSKQQLQTVALRTRLLSFHIDRYRTAQPDTRNKIIKDTYNALLHADLQNADNEFASLLTLLNNPTLCCDVLELLGELHHPPLATCVSVLNHVSLKTHAQLALILLFHTLQHNQLNLEDVKRVVTTSFSCPQFFDVFALDCFHVASTANKLLHERILHCALQKNRVFVDVLLGLVEHMSAPTRLLDVLRGMYPELNGLTTVGEQLPPLASRSGLRIPPQFPTFLAMGFPCCVAEMRGEQHIDPSSCIKALLKSKLKAKGLGILLMLPPQKKYKKRPCNSPNVFVNTYLFLNKLACGVPCSVSEPTSLFLYIEDLFK